MVDIVTRTPVETAAPVHPHPLMDRIYRSRKNVLTAANLDYAIQNMESYKSFKDIEKGAAIIVEAIRTGKRIICIGDYDVDGATSSSIVMEALQYFGVTNAEFFVPNRFTSGYGLKPEVVEAVKGSRPDVFITVDNGISSIEGVKAVKDLPWNPKIVVTDHHLAPEVLPEADAIINPQQADCNFPDKNIAGCGVAFYTMMAVRDQLKAINWFEQNSLPEPQMGRLLDLVALGLICDVVPLSENNRVLIANGLMIINSELCRPGIYALLEAGDRIKEGPNGENVPIVASDMGFCVGPALNAAGRLDDMTAGIHCLLAKSLESARKMANNLHNFNKERKAVEKKMKDDAMVELSRYNVDDMYSLVVYDKDFHEGVQGIVASRLKDHFNRPTICFAQGEGGVVKGSGRSIEGFHMKHALDAVNATLPGVFAGYGGHAMAAGMSVNADRFEEFKQAFELYCSQHITDHQLEGTIETDGELTLEMMNLETALLIESEGPWGQHFPEPNFYGIFDILEDERGTRAVGGNHLKMLVRPVGSDMTFNGICFNCIDDSGLLPHGRQMLIYRLAPNRFRGQETLQLMVERILTAPEMSLTNERRFKNRPDGLNI